MEKKSPTINPCSDLEAVLRSVIVGFSRFTPNAVPISIKSMEIDVGEITIYKISFREEKKMKLQNENYNLRIRL